jgi:cytochrome c2
LVVTGSSDGAAVGRRRGAACLAVAVSLAACTPASPPDDTATAAAAEPPPSRAAEAQLEPPTGALHGLPFAEADLGRGELLSLACQACHTFRAGEEPKEGPNLNGVFGRRAGRGTDFDYSDALRDSGIVWTPEQLDAWLKDPAGFVAGTKMGFTGYRSAADRRDLIAFLMRATAPPAD